MKIPPNFLVLYVSHREISKTIASMNSQPYQSIQFDWLASSGDPELSITPDQGDIERSTHPLPGGIGTSSFETLNLAMGMSIYRAVNRISSPSVGQLISAAEIKVDLKGPTFQAQIVRGGRVLEKQLTPPADLILSPGVDLFRYSDRYRIVPMIESDTEMTCLSIERGVLESLIGEDEVSQLLKHLDLNPMPRAVAAAMPLHVSAHLHASLSPTLTGGARKLYCQARALDYLTALLEQTKTVSASYSIGAKKRSQDVHDLLVNAQGKLPTLNELASQFGCSARTLNDEFVAVYGDSIYTFITNQRLTEAHEAIVRSDLPLKVLAFRLGYAHVNHFNTAFRKKFGYPPGSLRKK